MLLFAPRVAPRSGATFSALLTCLCLPALRAQEPPREPTRSSAASRIGQLGEGNKIDVPRAEFGQEAGAGTGPMVLMVRRADGALELHELQRAGGAQGPATDVPPDAGAIQDAADPKQAESEQRLVLARRGTDWTVGTKAKPDVVVGKQFDRAGVTKLLQDLRTGKDKVKDKRQLDYLLLDPAPEVTMELILGVWDVARGLGWQHVMFDNAAGRDRRPGKTEQELIAGIAAKHAWPVRHVGYEQRNPLCSGELLVMVAASTPWSDACPLLGEFARNGIWKFGFVAKKDDKTWVKLPTHLSFDAGAMK